MAEYWKSTPSYWCKFCSTYVRDTGIERKNHEASAKHQNNIQRSLRDLHRTQERESRDQQRAKDEVARLNNLVNGKPGEPRSRANNLAVGATGHGQAPSAAASAQLTTAQQRKAHAEQLAALGVELPEELKREVTGVGSFQTVSEQEIADSNIGATVVERSLADVIAEARGERYRREVEEDEKDPSLVKQEDEWDRKDPNILKRRADDEDNAHDEEAPPKRRNWGSNLKVYPNAADGPNDGVDLDKLLSGVNTSKQHPIKSEDVKEENKEPHHAEDADAAHAVVAGDVPAVKQEPNVPLGQSVVFKKRKGKR